MKNTTTTTKFNFKSIGSLILLVVFNLLLNSSSSFASHAAGSDLTYHCLGGLTYQIEVTFYRDCAGVAEPDSVDISLKASSHGYNLSRYATKIAGTGTEITVPCASAASTCNGGTAVGIRKFVYQATVTLPGAATDWVFSYSICCRNCSITTINNPCGNNSNLYVEAKLNNVLAPGNSSPTFSNNPVAFVCIGQSFTFNHGALDIDGDSLSYSLIAPKTGANSSVTFIAPASATSPLASSTPFAINPVTGDINFAPTTQQIGVMAVLVKEYRQGQLIGSVIRDMQVYTTVCNNSLPTMSGINGSNNNTLTVCPNQQICFDINTDDPDSGQILTLTTNQGIQGASYIISSDPHPTLHFCWTPTFADVNLMPHTFTVTLQDNACPNNGVQTFSINIYVPSPYFNATTTDVTCHGLANGTATAVPVYGGNYTYTWSTVPVSNASTITGLAPGTYTITVTDTNQCSTSTTVTINEPDSLNVTANTYDALCHGSSDGLIDITVTGGTQAYSYNWSNGQTTEDISGLTEGMYNVTVTDANQCQTYAVLQINEPDALVPSVTSNDAICTASNGTAMANATGGTAPYTFLWNIGTTGQNIGGLSAGTYYVSIMDSHQCSASDSVTINTIPSNMSASMTVNDVSCNGGTNGSINLFVFGGNAPFMYSWSDGDSIQNISGLSAGSFNVNVVDIYGCTTTSNALVSQPDSLVGSLNVINADCNNNDGALNLSVQGGTAPYSYSWSTGDTIQSLSGLASGMYTVMINDANGCITTSTETVSQVLMALTSQVTNVSLCGGSDGAIDLTVTNGNAPLQYAWDNGATTEDINGLVALTYCVQVTDASGCIADSCLEITQPCATGINNIGGSYAGLTLVSNYPNPFSYSTTIIFGVADAGKIKADLYSTDGKLIAKLFDQSVNKNSTNEIKLNRNNLSAGVYFLQISSEKERLTSKIMIE